MLVSGGLLGAVLIFKSSLPQCCANVSLEKIQKLFFSKLCLMTMLKSNNIRCNVFRTHLLIEGYLVPSPFFSSLRSVFSTQILVFVYFLKSLQLRNKVQLLFPIEAVI